MSVHILLRQQKEADEKKLCKTVNRKDIWILETENGRQSFF